MSEFNISIPGGESKRLLTGGKYCPADIVVTAEGASEVSFELNDGQVVSLEDAISIAVNGAQAKRLILGENVLWEHSFGAYYQRVAYLESTGTQYIDTGYYPTQQNIKLTAKYQYTLGDNGQSLFGSEYSGVAPENNGNYSIVLYRYNGAVSLYLARSMNLCSTIVNANVDIDLIVETKDGIVTFNINGVQSQTEYVPPFYSLDTMALFASKRDGVAHQFSKSRIYEFSIFENDVQVRNFIPCYRRSDSVAGMFDSVNNVFYTNVGTGVFTVGPDDNEATETDYLDALSTLGVDV